MDTFFETMWPINLTLEVVVLRLKIFNVHKYARDTSRVMCMQINSTPFFFGLVLHTLENVLCFLSTFFVRYAENLLLFDGLTA